MNQYVEPGAVTLYGRQRTVEIYELPTVFGKAGKVSDIFYYDPTIDDAHCRFDVYVDPETGEAYATIMDLGTMMGTRVEGVRLDPNTEYFLHDGQRLVIGRVKFVVQVDEERVQAIAEMKREEAARAAAEQEIAESETAAEPAAEPEIEAAGEPEAPSVEPEVIAELEPAAEPEPEVIAEPEPAAEPEAPAKSLARMTVVITKSMAVNGEDLEAGSVVTIGDGDVIRIGEEEFKFERV